MSLEDLKSRILNLKESLDQFKIDQTLKFSDVLDKMNILLVKLKTINADKNAILEPYAVLSQAEYIPNIYLRAKLTPEIESLFSQQQESDSNLVIDRIIYEKNVINNISYTETLKNDFKNIRYIQKNEDYDELAREEEQAFKSLIVSFSRGEAEE